MQVESLDIPDIKLITRPRHGDSRGFFSEIYSDRDFATAGIDYKFVQENCSVSAQANTVRGLHWQTPPCAQTKLVQVLKGAILDVVVDIRVHSPWFGQHIAVELSAENWLQLLVPAGFAHGFCTLDANTTVLYKVDNYYSAQHDCGIRWDDVDLGINWPVTPSTAILSNKDQRLPRLADCSSPFVYSETSP